MAQRWPRLCVTVSYDTARGQDKEGTNGRLLHVADAAPGRYRRHEPEKTVLYKIIAEHLETFLAEAREQYQRGLPKYVEKEFRAYLDCGLPSRGFARAVCDRCGRSLVVAFSCYAERESICSCGLMHEGHLRETGLSGCSVPAAL